MLVEGRWDNHDHVRPIKSLLGGLLFIGLGAWYLFHGAKAESWRDQVVSTNHSNSKNQSPESRRNFKSFVNELERDPAFPAVHRKVEVEMREKTRQMEKSIECEKNI